MKFKKIIYLALTFILTLLLGCEKEFDNIIEIQNSNYQVDSVFLKSFIQYPADSVTTFSIKLSTSSDIGSVFYDIYSPDNIKLNSLSFFMLDDGKLENGDSTAGDKIYSSKIKFDSTDIVGSYSVKYFVKDIYDRIKQVAFSKFFYDNGQIKYPPFIFNLILTDSVQRNVKFVFSVDVSDSNGLSDITSVYYELFRPDGTKVINSQNISEFPLFDDGIAISSGDSIANDGRYTIFLTFPISVSPGFWRFEVNARDRSAKQSNKIIKSVKVL